ncbi:MAG: hypothetical protein F6K19_27350 [Cyanothece sp. SIO1E1]|nr:hypothetical protein [Cyanothece sp. SIO1E1]
MKQNLQQSETRLSPGDSSGNQTVKNQAFSFRIWSTKSAQTHQRADAKSKGSKETVQPFPVRPSRPQIPTLPKSKLPSFSNHRNGVNPELAVNLSQEIEGIAAAWKTELQQLLLRIQSLYMEGPIIDGWLESYPQDAGQADGAATIRHADTDRLMDYVEEVCRTQANASSLATASDPEQHRHYRLCGLDVDGKSWSRLCPPEQLSSVSMAIARYQKLRQLLDRKQYLEIRLNSLTDSLLALREQLQEN